MMPDDLPSIVTEDSEFLDVLRFHRKFGQLNHDTPTHLTLRKLKERHDFMLEELVEFDNAMCTHDMAQMADALIDLVYVAKGTAVMMGLPWKALWDDVQRANMAKVVGITHRGNKVDVAKPPGWVPPKTMKILEENGYDPAAWFEVRGDLDPVPQLDLFIDDEVNR